MDFETETSINQKMKTVAHLGRQGEREAALFLLHANPRLHLLDWRYRRAGGEIDLVVEIEKRAERSGEGSGGSGGGSAGKGGARELVFVEVKRLCRGSSWENAVARVDWKKRRAMMRAGRHYLRWKARRGRYTGVRFDLLIGSGKSWWHAEDIF